MQEMSYSQVEGILYNYKMIQASIENNKIKLDDLELEDQEDGMPSLSYGDPSSKTNKINRAVETAAIINIERKQDIQREIEKIIRKETNKLKRIDNALAGLNKTERIIITLFYIEGKTWTEVASTMNYSASWCQDLRQTAMKKVVQIINGKTPTDEILTEK